MPLTPSQIASVTRAPRVNVERCWPHLVAALEEQGIRCDLVEVAVAATVAVETGVFLPIRERLADPKKGPAQARIRQLQDRYWPSGFYGRGFVQLTWERNYRTTGQALGLDLVRHPDLALDPQHAARILAHYFRAMAVDAAAKGRDWAKVRRLVNGGTHGLDLFLRHVAGLEEALRV